MAKLSIVAGATSQSVNIFIQDSSSTVGAGLSGLVFNSSGLIAYYTFTGANATSTQITLATLAAVNSAYSSGGFKEIDATNMKGLYRLDLPNAALATSKGRVVTVQLGGATNMAPCVLEIELTGWDNQDAVHGGMSSLPNTAVTTNASLITSGAGTDQLSVNGGRGKSDVSFWNAAAVASPITSGVPVVDWTPSPAELTGTATASAAATITLANTASATANFYSGMLILITSGTGKGQARIITGYTTGRVATVTPAWTTTPASTATYIIFPVGPADLEVLLAGNSSSGAAVTNATAGILDVNSKNINNVSASSVTTINANVGTTQPENFTGTGASALIKVDVTDIAAAAVATGSAQLGVNLVNVAGSAVATGTAQLGVNVVNIGGSASVGAAGSVGIDWAHVSNPTTALDLSGTTIKNVDNAIATVTTVTNGVTVSTNNDKTGYSLSAGQLFIKKNTALNNFLFLMTDSTTHAPKTGLTVTATRDIDNGGYAATANSVTEVANGMYIINFAASDLNGAVIGVRMTAVGADDLNFTIITQA